VRHPDHVKLLRNGIPAGGGVWADLGAGDGAFTLALAQLLGPQGTIYAVDKEARALRRLAQAMQEHYPAVGLHCLAGDFTRSLDLPVLDGILMANSLHFVREKDALLQRVRSHLKADGRLILVEYNTDRGNFWVPHPLSYSTWQSMSRRNGFDQTELLATHPSSFLGEFYAAASWVSRSQSWPAA
jgi:ubiquinone/menaquinone biosynthesis C-methylase UbiE